MVVSSGVNAYLMAVLIPENSTLTLPSLTPRVLLDLGATCLVVSTNISRYIHNNNRPNS